jgi:hypothetical protein
MKYVQILNKAETGKLNMPIPSAGLLVTLHNLAQDLLNLSEPVLLADTKS